MPHHFYELPPNLPVPTDDGACSHLRGMAVPHVSLPSTRGRVVDVAEASRTPTIFYIYPKTGQPGIHAPDHWDEIPGARGCTPQSVGFRDLYPEFHRRGFAVYGLSAQSSEDQAEFANRVGIPYELLSDARFELAQALRLPTFSADGQRFLKRLTLVVTKGSIRHFFYPVFPPNENPRAVLDYLDRTA